MQSKGYAVSAIISEAALVLGLKARAMRFWIKRSRAQPSIEIQNSLHLIPRFRNRFQAVHGMLSMQYNGRGCLMQWGKVLIG